MITIRSFILCTAVAVMHAKLEATTIIINEINNESNASLTIRFPNGQQRKVSRLDTLLEDITIVDASESTHIETPPIVFAEGKMKLFDIQFIRERKTYASGRTEVTFKIIQDGKKIIAQKKQGYLLNQDVYVVDITIKPGKGSIIAFPTARIEAKYGDDESIETNWQEINKQHEKLD